MNFFSISFNKQKSIVFALIKMKYNRRKAIKNLLEFFFLNSKTKHVQRFYNVNLIVSMNFFTYMLIILLYFQIFAI